MIPKHRITDSDLQALVAAAQREPERRKLLQFSPNLDMGSILTFVSIVFVAGIGWNRIESNDEKQVLRTNTIETRATEQEARTTKALTDVKEDVKEVKAEVKAFGGSVSDIKTKIDLLSLQISQQQPRRP